MPPPSPLSIATSSITRLLKEESSYRTELASQQKKVEKLQTEDNGAGNGDGDGDAEEEEDGEEKGNREWRLRQEKQAVEETKAVFGPLRERIEAAVEKVEGMLDSGSPMDDKEVEAARDAVGRAKAG
ncbi:hypothetical protein JMJ35_002592 [Cladonia borealis]|uniref:Tubulin-specific chaperone A n=1 Tax=Cladonia borealis TaxID=184061 RepID=A0AA39R8E2_9LECA|nr:hypothetical protein JMJ35_002592 [Cladonia borealis]